MQKKLLLFDIDGTLLNMSAINRRILVDALLKVYGTSGSAETCNFAGKMDSRIIYEILQSSELSTAEIAAKFELAKRTYIEMFRAEATVADVVIMPGIYELLDELSRHSELLLGLLTGNFEGSGRHKLELPGINHYFPFGAFADDGHHRNELPPVAIRKAYELTGQHFSDHDIIIIGDTEHDIACAKTVNAKSIAVATGTYPANELQRHQPHVLYNDLSQTDVVLAEILTSSTN